MLQVYRDILLDAIFLYPLVFSLNIPIRTFTFLVINARVAQLAVQLTRNEQVVGSIPISG